MDHRNLTFKTAIAFNARQLLHVHLYSVPTYRQVVFPFVAFHNYCQQRLLQNLEHCAPVGNNIFTFQFTANTDRTRVKVLLSVVPYCLPVGISNDSRHMKESEHQSKRFFSCYPFSDHWSTYLTESNKLFYINLFLVI